MENSWSSKLGHTKVSTHWIKKSKRKRSQAKSVDDFEINIFVTFYQTSIDVWFGVLRIDESFKKMEMLRLMLVGLHNFTTKQVQQWGTVVTVAHVSRIDLIFKIHHENITIEKWWTLFLRYWFSYTSCMYTDCCLYSSSDILFFA